MEHCNRKGDAELMEKFRAKLCLFLASGITDFHMRFHKSYRIKKPTTIGFLDGARSDGEWHHVLAEKSENGLKISVDSDYLALPLDAPDEWAFGNMAHDWGLETCPSCGKINAVANLRLNHYRCEACGKLM